MVSESVIKHHKRKISFIVNPFSGLSKKSKIHAKIHSAFDQSEFDIDIALTEYSGHAKELSQRAVANCADTVVAVGGDGSVNEVFQALVNTDVKFGVVSMGSGNGFARYHKLHQQHTLSFEKIKQAKTIQIDTCRINDIPFINLAGIGFDAYISKITKKSKWRGLWRYLYASLSSINKATPFDAEICFDNRCIVGNYRNIVIANGPLYGFNFSIAPRASMTDGVMNLMTYSDASITRYLAAIPRLMTSKIDQCSFVDSYRATSIRIKTTRPIPIHLDGEFVESLENINEFHVEIQPHSIQLII